MNASTLSDNAKYKVGPCSACGCPAITVTTPTEGERACTNQDCLLYDPEAAGLIKLCFTTLTVRGDRP